jgi:hypothetical protein
MLPDKLHRQYDERYQKQQNGNTVNAMHVLHPLRIRPVGILFPDVKIFAYLPPNAHLSPVL